MGTQIDTHRARAGLPSRRVTRGVSLGPRRDDRATGRLCRVEDQRHAIASTLQEPLASLQPVQSSPSRRSFDVAPTEPPVRFGLVAENLKKDCPAKLRHNFIVRLLARAVS